MKVDTIMSKHPITVARTTSLDRAIELMDSHEVRHLPVMHDEALIGMISDRDLLDATGWLHPSQRKVLEAPEGTVGNFMSSPVTTISSGDRIDTALELIVAEHIGCLAVLDEGKLVGVVTEIDILRCYADACRIGRIASADDPFLGSFHTPNPRTLTPEDSGSDAERVLSEARVRHLPVLDGGRLVGIVSDRDVRLLRGRGRLELSSIAEMMSPNPRTLPRTHRLSSAALLMSSERISALPVMEDDAMVGIATLSDLAAPCVLALQQLD